MQCCSTDLSVVLFIVAKKCVSHVVIKSETFLICDLFVEHKPSFSPMLLNFSLDLQGASTNSKLRTRECKCRVSLAPKGRRDCHVWQFYWQQNSNCQHHQAILPQHSPALYVPHDGLFLYCLLPASVQERDIPSWKGELMPRRFQSIYEVTFTLK